MTNQEILTKAIQKAIAGGFDLKKWPSSNARYWPDYLSEQALTEHVTRIVNDMRLEHLIFNHDFAKSIWPGRMLRTRRPKWHFHLQQMVISPDPIAYLGRNLDV